MALSIISSFVMSPSSSSVSTSKPVDITLPSASQISTLLPAIKIMGHFSCFSVAANAGTAAAPKSISIANKRARVFFIVFFLSDLFTPLYYYFSCLSI